MQRYCKHQPLGVQRYSRDSLSVKYLFGNQICGGDTLLSSLQQFDLNFIVSDTHIRSSSHALALSLSRSPVSDNTSDKRMLLLEIIPKQTQVIAIDRCK